MELLVIMESVSIQGRALSRAFGRRGNMVEHSLRTIGADQICAKTIKKDGKISLDPVEYIKPIEEVVDGTTGTATLRWSDGSSYVGETYRTTLHGTGTMTYSDKGKYHGQWKYSHRDGVGTMVYPDGSKYCGSWERDLPNGNGTFQTPEGIMYTVNFENGIPHGKGVIQDLDGRKYSARWVRGKLKEKSIKPLEE